MNVTLNWLNDYIEPEISDIKSFADKMTMSGSKVESIITTGEGLSGIVAGKVLSFEPHKYSMRLHVCKVDVGDKILNLVTGADNIKAGDTVPVALVGAVIAGGVQIDFATLQNEPSEGMMCSIVELGFDKTMFPDAPEKGIYVFKNSPAPGTPVSEILNLGEKIIEFEITSNRPDCLSVEGLAREAAVTCGKKFKPVVSKVKGDPDFILKDILQVEIHDEKICSRYIARGIKNVKIAPSPAWMQSRLRDCGVRPINNIVDITNYVMLELGQPMHAFDYKNIRDGKINIRPAYPGEKTTTLEGITHELDDTMPVIADGVSAVALAGIMGGEGSSITDSTETIVFESANFNPLATRKTAGLLNMRTESSSRFEKNLDAVNAKRAMDRACELVELLGCGVVSIDEIDLWPVVQKSPEIPFRPQKINDFLGTDIDIDFMESTLRLLGCDFIADGEKRFCVPPTFRKDLQRDVDLAEEIARFYGYNNIEPRLHEGRNTGRGGLTSRQKQRNNMKSVLLSAGFSEACTYSFLSPKAFDNIMLDENDPLRDAVVISNPLGEDFSLMRTTMLPSMLEIARVNLSRDIKEFNIFEIAKTYYPECDKSNNGGADRVTDRVEDRVADSVEGRVTDRAGGRVTDRVDEELLPEREFMACVSYINDDDYPKAQTFFRLKGILEEIGNKLFGKPFDLIPVDNAINSLHPGRSAFISFEDKQLGIIGYIHPEVAEKTNTDKKVAVILLDIDDLLNIPPIKPIYEPLPKFPPLTRDISFVINKEITAESIQNLIVDKAGQYLEYCRLFDLYVGKQIPEDKKSMTFELAFRSKDRTLSDADIAEYMAAITEGLNTEFDANLR